jgi:hypothetical protein
MKIAVIIYGRCSCNLEASSSTWGFLNTLDCDVYVSTWKIASKKNTKLDKIYENVITNETIKNCLKTNNICIDDESNYTFTNGNNIERCVVHWNNCIKMILDNGIKYDNIMLLRIDSYIFPSFDTNTFLHLNKSDRIYGMNEIHFDKQGQYNIDPTFFFGTFNTMIEFLTNFPHHSTSLHTLIPEKIISMQKFVEAIDNLNIAILRPNFDELSDEEKKDPNVIRQNSLDFEITSYK